MPLEIEIKLKLDSHAPTLRLLRQLRAKHLQHVHETNIFFDRSNNSLRTAGAGLRVRLETPIKNPKSKIKNPTALLTFKGPPQKTGLRSRNAFDLTCSPADQLIPLLKSLGYQQVLLFEKIRDSWLLDRCRIELDTLPELGLFLEIEGPSESTVKKVQKKLQLAHLPQHETSYAKMTSAHLAKRKKKELRFRH